MCWTSFAIHTMPYKNLLCCALSVVGLAAVSTASAQELLLTELLSKENSSGAEDFWELTNVGTQDVDLTGWSWDDDSRAPGTVAIPAGTTVEPGESVIFTAMDAAAFRNWWNLPETVQVISDASAPGFGKNDGGGAL